MENIFGSKLKDICAQALGSEEEKKEAIKICLDLNLSEREELVLNNIFGPTPENVLVFLELYKTYLPYLRGQKNKLSPMLKWEEAANLDVGELEFESVDVLGMFLRSAFLWSGQKEYESVVREFVRKMEILTSGTFDFSGVVGSNWEDIYYRLTLLVMSENFAFLEDRIQVFFVGSKFLYGAIASGFDMDYHVGQAVDYFIYLSVRFDFASNLAVFLYANDEEIGFNPENEEPVKISFWIDKFRVYSDKKFDSLSLMNFFQDNNIWGTNNDYFSRSIINQVLRIYSHLITGFFVYPEISDIDVKKIKNQIKNEQKQEPEVTTSPKPNLLNIKSTILKEASNLSGDDEMTFVLNKLSELSDQYNDPTISDLYYFDEGSGEFKWKV